MNHPNSHLKFIDLYISKYHPRIHEITSLEDVLVVSMNGYFLFSYGKQSIIGIKRRKRKIFGTGQKVTYINNGYTVKGIYGLSNLLAPMLSLPSDKFNIVMMEWIKNKHPEIDSVIKLYDFCMDNHKNYNDVKHLWENN